VFVRGMAARSWKESGEGSPYRTQGSRAEGLS